MPSVAILGSRGYPSYYGGFETLVRQLAPYLANHGWTVTVYGRPDVTTRTAEASDREISNVLTRGIERKSLSTLTYGCTAAIKTIRQRPDVALIVNVANGYWLPSLHWNRIPTLVNVDGIEWERAKWGRLARAVFRGGARLTARYASGIVCDAGAIQEYWWQKYKVRGAYIPYGAEQTEEPPPVEPGLTHRGYVLLVARFVPENSVPEFLNCAEDLSASTDIVIVGSSGHGGALEKRVRDLSARNSRVRWLGHVSNDQRLQSLWHHSAVYFHGHSVGGTNPALVQAMASGAPIVARDTIYNREVLGEAGIYCKAESSNIAAAITRILSSPVDQERYSELASTRAKALFTWEAVCAKYESTLAGLVSDE